MILKKDIILDSNPLLRKKSEDVALPLSKEDEKLLEEVYNAFVEACDDEEDA